MKVTLKVRPKEAIHKSTKPVTDNSTKVLTEGVVAINGIGVGRGGQVEVLKFASVDRAKVRSI